MMLRKIIANLLLGLLAPIVLQMGDLPDVYRAIFFNDYTYSDSKLSSLGEFLMLTYHSYFVFYFSAMLFFLLPFQVIKDYLKRKEKQINLFQKFLLLSGIVLFWFLLSGLFFVNIWATPWYYNFGYLGIAAAFGAVFSILCYLLIDRYNKLNER